jgi:hypothetical protein
LGARAARSGSAWRAACLVITLLLAICSWSTPACAQQVDISLPEPNFEEPVTVQADRATHWTQGAYEVWHLEGSCMITQGLVYARAAEGVIWVERAGPNGVPPNKVIAYLEGKVTIDYQAGTDGIVEKDKALLARVAEEKWLGRFSTTAPLKLKFGKTSPPSETKPAIYERGMEAREPKFRNPVKPAQFAEPNTGVNQPAGPPGATLPIQALPDLPSATSQPLVGVPGPLVDPQQIPPLGTRRVRAFPRSDSPLQFQAFQDPATGERVVISNAGLNLVVDGMAELGSVDVSADRLVMWTQGDSEPLMGGAGLVQGEQTPLELYLEGNIVFRQGDRVLFAQRMYYDVRRQVGVVLDSEMVGNVPTFDGAIRLRSRVLEQISPTQFLATDASLTTSQLGVPSYDLRTGSMLYEDIQEPEIDAEGRALVDADGDPLIKHRRMATSRGNTIYFGQVPVFYWPVLAANLEEPAYYLRDFQVRQDRIFGTALFVDWNAYQVLGIKNAPKGTKWDFSTDYLSMRGPATGTSFTYNTPTIFGYPYKASGLFDAWGIHDDGHDNLGLDRRDLQPEKGPWRGRIFSRDRFQLPNDFRLTTELAVISDYNFQEQYFEQEWDQFKDETNDIELKQQRDYWSWAVYGQMRLNDFYTETQWMPRFDHFTMGRSLLDDRLTWFEHTNVGYAQLAIQQPPTNAADLASFSYLPWVPHLSPTVPGFSPTGDREATRQEIDLPFDINGVKLVPYALGEISHWGQVLDGSDFSRAYGQLGARGSVPFWSINPNIRSQLFNVNGIAHKISFDVDASVTQTSNSQSPYNLPLYDLIDDQSILRYRQLLATYDFGTPNPVPLKYDERNYALRYGLMNSVASPSTEIAGNMAAIRLGARQRWQTKRGAPGKQRVVDWMTFDVQGVVFPDPNRDNFGTAVGLVNYTWRWYLGDRTTVVSDGVYDFFSGAPQYTSVGMYLNRPPRGSLYAGIMQLNGPINSTVLATSYNYRMSPKWISTAGSTFALNHSGNIGENFALTRIGEAFLFNVSMNVDVSKGNVGAAFSLQPRFLSRTGLGGGNGLQIPVAGAFGLE